MIELTPEQKQRIGEYVNKFKEFLKSETGKEWDKERNDRLVLFRKLLSEEKVVQLSKDDFGKIIIILWASQIWGNKEYLVNTIISRNGLQKLRNEFNALIYGKETLEKRYDRFRKNIKGLGGASITEILAFVSPNEYCIWNRTPINVLPFLKMKNLLPSQIHPSYIKGKHYVRCNDVLKLIKDELEDKGLENPNFIDVDHFLYYIFVYEMPEKEMVPQEKVEEKVELIGVLKGISTHEEAEAILLELGNMFGFKTYTPDLSKQYKGRKLGDISTLKEIPSGFFASDILDIIKEIDVIWFKKDVPEYCFEVEHTTDIIKGLWRLYQIEQLKGVKFFIIAPLEAYPKFEKFMLRRPFKDLKDKCIFKSYRDLISLYNLAIKFYPLRTKFGID